MSADVGLQANGMPLSVLSMLARQDIDPWDETAHLSKMPRGEAVARLSSRIAAASVVQPDRRSVSLHASDLIALLPSFAGVSQTAAKPLAADAAEAPERSHPSSPSIHALNRRALHCRLLLVAVAAVIVTAMAFVVPPANVRPAGSAVATGAPSASSFQPHHF